jgi:hypothetical protein
LNNDKRALEREVGVAGSDSVPLLDAGGDADVSDPGGRRADSGAANSCTTMKSPECMPMKIDTDMRACGPCGAGVQTRMRGCSVRCSWGAWSAWTDCQLPDGVCTPGEPDQKQETCGNCGSGTRKSTRTCEGSCAWSNWNQEPCVEDETKCEPGSEMPLPDISCDSMCGRATQKRVCSDSCEWGTETGACAALGVCLPGQTRTADSTGCNANFCNKGLQARIETCTQNCMWGAPTNSGSCAIPTGVCRPVDLGGMMGWRCRANDRGYRELCYDSTASETDRCTYHGREAYPACN